MFAQERFSVLRGWRVGSLFFSSAIITSISLPLSVRRHPVNKFDVLLVHYVVGRISCRHLNDRGLLAVGGSL